MTRQITWDQFESEFNPISNHLDDNASMGGLMFETFGNEIDFVNASEQNKIWTVYADYGNIDLMSGYHYVNRIGYIITEKAFDEDIEVINEDYDDDYIEF